MSTEASMAQQFETEQDEAALELVVSYLHRGVGTGSLSSWICLRNKAQFLRVGHPHATSRFMTMLYDQARVMTQLCRWAAPNAALDVWRTVAAIVERGPQDPRDAPRFQGLLAER
jgi:hypothetical protein